MIPGERHMECAYYFDFCWLFQLKTLERVRCCVLFVQHLLDRWASLHGVGDGIFGGGVVELVDFLSSAAAG